jgi:hypothetical protein
MAGHAARRWILEVRLDRRVDEVFLARFWKKDIQSAFRKRDKNRRYGMRPSSNGPRWISVSFLENLLPKAVVEHFHYARQCSIIQARTSSLRAIATLALGRPRRPQR